MLEKKCLAILTVAGALLAMASAGTALVLADDPPTLTPTLPHRAPAGEEERTPADRVSGEPIEVAANRSAYAKHYHIGPGRFRAVISAAPVHYLDEDGRWQDIDTDITRLPDGTFASEANSVKMRFPTRLGPASAIAVDTTVHPATAPSWQRVGAQGAEKEPVDVAASSRDFSVAWRPQAMAFSDGEGNTMLIANVAATAGEVQDNIIRYPEAFPHTTEEFRVLPGGFKHNLILSALPKSLADSMSTLDYSGELALPPEITLFVDGVEQEGDFTTGSDVELRDQQGESVGYLMAPYVYEQDNPRQGVKATYAIHHEAGRITVAVRTPLAWLTDDKRTYPVVIDPALYIGFLSDANIIQGMANHNLGGWWFSYVGYYPSPAWLAERGLVKWDVDVLPENVTINSAYTELYLLYWGGLATCDIGTHRVTSDWAADQVTWNQHHSGANWGTPGGDYDATPEATTSVGTNYDNWINMGDITGLVTGWHNGTYPNYGVLYKRPGDVSGVYNERMFAQDGYGSAYAPRLYVDYTFPVTTLSAYLPQTRNTPSNVDYYDHQVPTQWSWRAIGIRPPADANYDIQLYSDSEFSHLLAGSSYGTGSVDFVVISKDAPQEVLYPKVERSSGSGDYQIEFAPSTSELNGEGGTHGPYTMDTGSVLRTWDFSGTVGETYRFIIQPISGNADLGIALYAPSSAGGDDYLGRGDAAASADTAGAGGRETMYYTVDDDVGYGLVVWNNGATAAEFTMNIGKPSVYLPIIGLNYDPLTNGDFEQGETGWKFGGELPSKGVFTDDFTRGYSAVLGDKKGPCQDQDQPGGDYKDESAWMEQTFTVLDVGNPTLSFWYRLRSYDKFPTAGPYRGNLKDSFDVYINPADGGQPDYRDLLLFESYGCKEPVNDTGGSTVVMDLSSYKGQTIVLRFETWNRLDENFNTWVYVDDVTVTYGGEPTDDGVSSESRHRPFQSAR